MSLRKQIGGLWRGSRFRLSTLVLLVTIAAILAGWFVDRRSLKGQIDPPEMRQTLVYRLTNAKAMQVATRLNELYPEQRAIVGKQNSVFVNVEERLVPQLEIIIHYLDLPKNQSE